MGARLTCKAPLGATHTGSVEVVCTGSPLALPTTRRRTADVRTIMASLHTTAALTIKATQAFTGRSKGTPPHMVGSRTLVSRCVPACSHKARDMCHRSLGAHAAQRRAVSMVHTVLRTGRTAMELSTQRLEAV